MKLYKIVASAIAVLTASTYVNAASDPGLPPTNSSLDQYFVESNFTTGSYQGFSTNAAASRIGEVFTAGKTGDLTSFSISLLDNSGSTNVDFVVSLYNIASLTPRSTSFPTGDPLTSGIFHLTEKDIFSSGGVIRSYNKTTISSIYTFDSSAHVVEGEKYALVVNGLGTNKHLALSGHTDISSFSGDEYEPKQFNIWYREADESWVAYLSDSMFFKTYVKPDSITNELGATGSTGGTGGASLNQPTGSSGSSGGGLQYPPISTVPEPETYAMMLAGLGVMGFIGKRRRKAI